MVEFVFLDFLRVNQKKEQVFFFVKDTGFLFFQKIIFARRTGKVTPACSPYKQWLVAVQSSRVS